MGQFSESERQRLVASARDLLTASNDSLIAAGSRQMRENVLGSGADIAYLWPDGLEISEMSDFLKDWPDEK